ncbi:MAG: DUF4097 family beta strand repeat-containing protein [Steroidobacteraceae bacterium]
MPARTCLARSIALALLLPIAVPAAGRNDGGQPVDRRIDAAGTTAVAITNVAGSVAVIGTARDDVHVTGLLGAGVERLELSREGNTVVVKVILPPKSTMSRSGAATLRVEVPRGHRAEVSGVSADLRISGVAGAQDLRTVSGDVISGAAGAAVEIKSVSGDVTFNGGGRAGSVKVSTVSGDIDLRAIAGELDAASISGDVEVGAAALQGGRIRTTSGEIDIDTVATAGTLLSVDSVSGDVDIRAHGSAGLVIEARSFSGDLTTCFGAEGRATSRNGPGRRLEATRGQGGMQLRVGSVSGEVAICDR